jgi:predicted TIM-barrel fold metal-dependent hydrolase
MASQAAPAGIPAVRALAEHVDALPLIDHHVHGALRTTPDRARFEGMLNEGYPGTPPAWMTPFDSQLGFAIRRWCAPLLGLDAGADADAYWAARAALGESEINRLLLPAARIRDWLVDTGYAGDAVLQPAEMAQISGQAREIVRLEAIAEQLAAADVSAAGYADAFRARLAEATDRAAGVKSVVAYRAGFALDWTRPAGGQVTTAAATWLGQVDAGGSARLTDPVLLRFGLFAALDRGLPIQLHVGFGDRDVDLRTANPLHLRDFLFAAESAGVPVLLLHCYPFEREAGYLAQAFTTVYLDVGLAINYAGARADAIVARTLEMAPFTKVLYSSDAWGPAELHYLGAVLWRRATSRVLGTWVEDGDWTAADARRVATLIASDNACRVYQLAASTH